MTERFARAAGVVSAALVALLSGCADPPSQVIVRLATDLSTPDELDAIRLQLLDHDGDIATDRVLGGLDVPGDRRFHEIGTFGVVPLDGDATRRFEVVAVAMLGGRELFRTRARTGFVRGRTIRLDVYVPELCLTVAPTCRPDETCGAPGCVSPDVDPASLPTGQGSPVHPPEDPRRAATALRLVSPPNGARLTTRRPTIRVDVDADAELVACADPGCAVELARVAVNADEIVLGELPPGPVFARVESAEARSPTWVYEIPIRGGASTSPCQQRIDTDGDGRPELFVAAPRAEGGGLVTLHRWDPTGRRSTTDLRVPADQPSVSDLGRSVDGADVDGDGRVDVVVSAPSFETPSDGAVLVFPGGDAAREPWILTGTARRFGTSVAAADFDADGYGDVALTVLDGSSTRVDLHRGGPGGPSLAPSGVLLLEPEEDGPEVRIFTGGDVDGDGASDLLVGSYRSGHGGVVIAYALRGGTWARVARLAPEALPVFAGARFGEALAFGDVDGNGRCDVVVGAPGVSAGEGSLFVWRDGALPVELEAYSLGAAALGASVGVADLDGDGYLEALGGQPGRSSGGVVQVLAGAQVWPGGSAQFGQDGERTVGVRMATPGDVDGDGLGDVAASTSASEAPGVVHLFTGGDPRTGGGEVTTLEPSSPDALFGYWLR